MEYHARLRFILIITLIVFLLASSLALYFIVVVHDKGLGGLIILILAFAMVVCGSAIIKLRKK